MPPLTITRIGYGAGTRDIGVPNVCRLILGEESGVANRGTGDGFAVESVTVLETNLDHLSPEELAFACEELLAEGALDVWQTPVVMKKGRLAVVLSALVAEADAPRLAAARDRADRVPRRAGPDGGAIRRPSRGPRGADRVGDRAGEGGRGQAAAGTRRRGAHRPRDRTLVRRRRARCNASRARPSLGPPTGSRLSTRPSQHHLRRRTSGLHAVR